MVRGSTVLLCLVVLTCLLISPVFADRSTEDLQSKIIERFDSPTADAEGKYEFQQNHRWIVRGSKFITEGYPKFSWVKTWPNALFPDLVAGSKESDSLHALGIKAAFNRKGYNYLEIIPVEEKDGADGLPVEKPIPIPGRVKLLDFWAYGSNLKYYLEIQLKDYRGMIHTLYAGDLTYSGWRNLKVEIPSGIPQEVPSNPSRRGIELVKLVLWTYPDEIVVPFDIYFDQIKVLTDMFESPYDGSTLADPKRSADLWASGTGTVDPKTSAKPTTTPAPAAK